MHIYKTWDLVLLMKSNHLLCLSLLLVLTFKIKQLKVKIKFQDKTTKSEHKLLVIYEETNVVLEY